MRYYTRLILWTTSCCRTTTRSLPSVANGVSMLYLWALVVFPCYFASHTEQSTRFLHLRRHCSAQIHVNVDTCKSRWPVLCFKPYFLAATTSIQSTWLTQFNMVHVHNCAWCQSCTTLVTPFSQFVKNMIWEHQLTYPFKAEVAITLQSLRPAFLVESWKDAFMSPTVITSCKIQSSCIVLCTSI